MYQKLIRYVMLFAINIDNATSFQIKLKFKLE